MVGRRGGGIRVRHKRASKEARKLFVLRERQQQRTEVGQRKSSHSDALKAAGVVAPAELRCPRKRGRGPTVEMKPNRLFVLTTHPK